MRAELKAGILGVCTDVRTLQTLVVGGVVKLVKCYRDEHLALCYTVETLEAWVKEVLEK